MIVFPARKFCFLLLVIATALSVISFVLQLVLWSTGSHVGGLVFLMNVDLEQNVPTWFSSILHFLVFLVLTTIAVLTKNSARPYFLHWAFVALLFGLFSLDEVASIHDQLPVKLFPNLNTFWRWIFPGSLFVLLLSVVLIPFVKSLPTEIKNRLFVGWSVFFGGALVVEYPARLVAHTVGEHAPLYDLLTTIEEGCEMVGVILILRALLLYLAAEFNDVHLQIRD